MVATWSRQVRPTGSTGWSAAGAVKQNARRPRIWEELLAQIDAGQVIPVVGPELLAVVADGREIPLYRVLAERLLAKYGLGAGIAGADGDSAPNGATVALRPHHELNDAVCALAHRGRRVQDLYRPINDLLRGLLEISAQTALQPLRDLAVTSGFRLFVTTTPDDLMARAIDAERHDGVAKTEHIVFAPKLASGTLGDLPEVQSSGYTAVCYLFGKASPSPFVFAIHDEDTLEFIHNLQINAGEGMKRLFSELRKQNLLLIGCNFADWLSRFFIRLSNVQRLADNRGKHESLIEESADNTGSLTLFLERFSPDTWLFPGSAREFVAELARRWQERHPRTGPRSDDTTEAVPGAPNGRHSLCQLLPHGPGGGPPALHRLAGHRRRRGLVRQERDQTGRRRGAEDKERHQRLLPVPPAGVGQHRDARGRLLPGRMDTS